jgi:CRP/FNR family cyclic AMP-dependent transcriptional regulator
MFRQAVYVSTELTDQPFFASALRMMGWSLVPYAQLDHALTHLRKNPADALILHAPLAGIELTQPLVDRIQRAANTKVVILGDDHLRDNRNQRVVPDPATAAELATSLSALCPTDGQVILHELLQSETFEAFTQEAVSYLLSRSAATQWQTAQVLFNEGDSGDSMFFILTGGIEIKLGGHSLVTLTTGSLFGEMSMLQGTPRSATAIASEPTVLLEVPAKVVEQADAEFRAILFELISRTLMSRLEESNRFVSSIEDAEIVDVSEALAQIVDAAEVVEGETVLEVEPTVVDAADMLEGAGRVAGTT